MGELDPKALDAALEAYWSGPDEELGRGAISAAIRAYLAALPPSDVVCVPREALERLHEVAETSKGYPTTQSLAVAKAAKNMIAAAPPAPRPMPTREEVARTLAGKAADICVMGSASLTSDGQANFQCYQYAWQNHLPMADAILALFTAPTGGA